MSTLKERLIVTSFGVLLTAAITLCSFIYLKIDDIEKRLIRIEVLMNGKIPSADLLLPEEKLARLQK